MVVLQPVPYGTAGPFAINVWVKVASVAGSLFEYVFSHNSTTPDTTTWGPNQVGLSPPSRLYLPLTLSHRLSAWTLPKHQRVSADACYCHMPADCDRQPRCKSACAGPAVFPSDCAPSIRHCARHRQGLHRLLSGAIIDHYPGLRWQGSLVQQSLTSEGGPVLELSR